MYNEHICLDMELRSTNVNPDRASKPALDINLPFSTASCCFYELTRGFNSISTLHEKCT